MQDFCSWEKMSLHDKKNLGKRVKNQNPDMYNTQEHNTFI